MSNRGGRKNGKKGTAVGDQKTDDANNPSNCSTPSCIKMWQSPGVHQAASGSMRTLYKSRDQNEERRNSLIVGKLPDGSDCPNCLKNVDRVKSLEQVVKLKDSRRGEVEMDLELTKSEIKDLRKILDESMMQGKQDLRLAHAVTTFHQEDGDSDLDEQDIKDILAGKEPKKKKKKKVEDKKQPTYFDPEVVVLDELDQALAEVADLQEQVKQFENLNKALQERYREAEVKNALAQFKISKLEKVKRAMELEKAERETAKANAKLEASMRQSEGGEQLYRTNSVYGIMGMNDLDAEKRLLGAAQNGDLATVKVLCDQVDAQLQEGKKPTKKLIDCRNRDGWTPLMLASARGHLPVVQKLISAGADYALTETDLGYTALHLAAWNNRPGVVTYLCGDVGVPVDPEGENWRTPLMLAANWGAVLAIKALLAYGAEPTRADIRGKTAMNWTRDDNIKKILLEAEKKVKQKQEIEED